MLILGRGDVAAALKGAEAEVCRTVSDTYVAHAQGLTSLPHSVFLRFPDDSQNRIIALPAFVGGPRPVAGVKWISSFPGNIQQGLERASAVILLNSCVDGRPVAMLDGSLISAQRTAAGAVVAATALTENTPDDVRSGLSVVGCGVINFEVIRFLQAQGPGVRRLALFDRDPARVAEFANRITANWPGVEIRVDHQVETTLRAHRLVSIATTASRPELDARDFQPGTVVLHLSLRDLTPESLLTARNVVDDIDHVCRAGTSVDLAAQSAGHRRFIEAEIGDILSGASVMPYDSKRVTVVSPFGLGVLDAAVAAQVLATALALGLGLDLPDFATDAHL